MRSILTSLVLVFSFLVGGFNLPSKADTWTNADINRTIQNTNFVVDGHCSGTLISSDLRLVLTNFHCVDERVLAKTQALSDVPIWQTRTDNFETLGNNVYQTRIVAMNKNKDVAVLQIKDKAFPKVPVAPMSTSYTRGEDVWIVGNPIMLEASVVKGIISNRNRVLEMDGVDHDYLQFSGGIIGGNSGGSLYNQFGDFIGIPSAGYPKATFLGFAIPTQVILGVMKDACLDYVGGKVVETTSCPGGSKLAK